MYIQLPNQESPVSLYGGEWENISEMYAGDFFRVEGGLASEFGQSQSSAVPNLTGTFHYNAEICGTSVGVFANSSTKTNYSGARNKTGYGGFSLNSSRCSSVYQDVTEVRVQNKTIRIWRRTA